MTNSESYMTAIDAIFSMTFRPYIKALKTNFTWIYDKLISYRNQKVTEVYSFYLADALVQKFPTLDKETAIYEACLLAAIRDNETGMINKTREHSADTYNPGTQRDLVRWIKAMGYGKGSKAKGLGNKVIAGQTDWESDAVKFRGWAFCQVTGRTNSVAVAQRVVQLGKSNPLISKSNAYQILNHLANGRTVSSSQMDMVAKDLIICEYATIAYYMYCMFLPPTATLMDFFDGLIAADMKRELTNKRSWLLQTTGYKEYVWHNTTTASTMEAKAIGLFAPTYCAVMGTETVSEAGKKLIAARIKSLDANTLEVKSQRVVHSVVVDDNNPSLTSESHEKTKVIAQISAGETGGQKKTTSIIELPKTE